VPLDAASITAAVKTVWPASDITCAEVGPSHAVARYVVPDAALRPGGYISGPTQFSVADCALWYAVFVATDRVEPMALTSELSIRFLRPAQGEVLVARAEIDAMTRRQVVSSVRLWIEGAPDRIVSVAQGTYVLPRPDAAS
jgi:uncharacterized protein (TIGR00369 family)